MYALSLTRVWLFVTPWAVAPRLLCQWEFSRQGYWSGLPCSPSRDLPHPGMEPRSSTLQADSLPSESPGKPKNTGVGGPTPSPGELPDPGTEPGFPAWRQILYQLTFSPNPQYTLTPFTDGSSYLASIPVGGASLRFLWPANFNGICRKPTGPCSLPCYVSLCPSFSPNV